MRGRLGHAQAPLAPPPPTPRRARRREPPLAPPPPPPPPARTVVVAASQAPASQTKKAPRSQSRHACRSPLAMYGSAGGGKRRASAAVDPEALRLLLHAHRWNAVVPVAAALLAAAALLLQLGGVVGALGVGYSLLALGATFLVAALTLGSLAALASDQTEAATEHPAVGGLFVALRRALGGGGPLGHFVGLALCLSSALGAACALLALAELALHVADASWLARTPLPWRADGSWAVSALASALLAALALAGGRAPRLGRRRLRWAFALSVMAALGVAASLLLPKASGDESGAPGWSVAQLTDNLAPHRPEQLRGALAALATPFAALLGAVHVTHDAVTKHSRFSRASHAHSPYRRARFAASRQLAVLGVHKALALAAGASAALVGALAASAPPAALLADRFLVPDSVDHVLGGVFVFPGVAASSLLAAFASLSAAACGFSAFFFDRRRPRHGRRPPLDVGRVAGASEAAAMAADTDASSAGRAGPAAAWVVAQTAILYCGALAPAVPLVAPATLLAFAAVNFACFFNEISSSTFRPSFRMYSQWTALLGSALSLGACFLVVSPVFLVAAAASLLAYVALNHRELARVVDDLRVAHRLRSKRRRRDAVEERILQQEARTPLAASSVSGFGPGADTDADAAPLLDVEQQPLTDGGDTAGSADTQSKRLELAALFVRDASDGRFLGTEYLIDGLNRTHYKRLYHALHYVRMANMGVLMALTFFEPPAWCFFSRDCGRGSARLLTWGLPVLPRAASLGVELACLTLLAAELAIKYRYMGRRIYLLNNWYIAQILVLLADCAAVLTVAVVPLRRDAADQGDSGSSGDSEPQYAEATRPLVLMPVLRPLLLLTMSHRLRSGFSSLLKTLPRFADGLLTLSILIALYAVLGMVLFEGSREADAYFSSFVEACTSLMVLLTTANFPDVMMPAYAQTRVASLFFVSFLAIGQLLVMNLVFASVYQHYRQEIVDRAAVFARRKRQALEAAFHLLPALRSRSSRDLHDAKVISRRTYQRLLTELLRPTISLFDDLGGDEHAHLHPPPGDASHSHSHGYGHSRSHGHSHSHSHSRAAFYSHWSDEDEENWIAYAEFEVLITRFLAREKKSAAAARRAAGYRFQRAPQRSAALVRWLRALPTHPYFEPAVDVVMLANLAAITVEIQAKIRGQEQLFLASEAWSPVFSVVFIAEMLLKMSALGIGAYVDRTKNVFDCLVTVVIVAAEVSVHAHNLAGEWRWIRVLLLLRFLRCLRLLVALQALSTMFATVVRLLPAFTTLYGMLGVIMALYGVLGMQLFGGKLVVGDPRLATIAYGQADYYSNNFNDFASALTTLFELLIVNNWFVIMDGAVAVTSKWSRLFFISYYVVAVVMVLSLVVAFVVEAYFETTQADSERRGSERSSSSSSLSRDPSSSSSDGQDEAPAAPYPRSPPPPVSAKHGKRLLTQRRGSVTPDMASLASRDSSIFVEDFL